MDEQERMRLAELAEAIYREVDGADHKQHKAALVQEIYDWLYNGSELMLCDSVESLAAEWREYQADAADVMDNGTD